MVQITATATINTIAATQQQKMTAKWQQQPSYGTANENIINNQPSSTKWLQQPQPQDQAQEMLLSKIINWQ